MMRIPNSLMLQQFDRSRTCISKPTTKELQFSSVKIGMRSIGSGYNIRFVHTHIQHNMQLTRNQRD